MTESKEGSGSNQTSIYKKIFAAYAIALALIILLTCILFFFFGGQAVEKLFEYFWVIVLAVGAISFPFISKHLK